MVVSAAVHVSSLMDFQPEELQEFLMEGGRMERLCDLLKRRPFAADDLIRRSCLFGSLQASRVGKDGPVLSVIGTIYSPGLLSSLVIHRREETEGEKDEAR